MNESRFIALYQEITACSENRARSVYMVVSEEPDGPAVAGLTHDPHLTFASSASSRFPSLGPDADRPRLQA